jgi:DNA-3-methyladenine glycosylase II
VTKKMKKISFQLNLTGPFDHRAIYSFWTRHKAELVDLAEEGVYKRLFFRDGRPVLLRIETSGHVDEAECAVTLTGDVAESETVWAEKEVRWILHDRAPLEEFYRHIALSDPHLAAVVKRLRGLRYPLSPDLFATLVFSILSQQVNLTFAAQCRRSLEEAYTRRATINGREYFAAISPQDLAGADVPDLRALKISNAKGRAILELAGAFRKRPLDRYSFAGKTKEEIIDTLVSFRGVGRWTAETVMVRALGLTDVLPAGDVGLQNIIRQFYGLAARPSEQELRDLGARWAPYGSLATFYIWMGLKLKVSENQPA